MCWTKLEKIRLFEGIVFVYNLDAVMANNLKLLSFFESV